MNLKLHTVVALSWILVAAILLNQVSCETSKKTTNLTSTKSKGRTARKYFEVDDLNTFESPTAMRVVAGSDEAINDELPKKLVKRSTQNNTISQRRPVRQNPQKKQKPGFFWTIARVTYETFNDTFSAIKQINQIVSEGIPNEKPKRKPPPKKSTTTVKPGKSSEKIEVTTQEPSTTTEEEYVLTRPALYSLVRRNVKGLVNLFNLEWKDAITQSKINMQDFKKELGQSIGKNLQDNPNNYK